MKTCPLHLVQIGNSRGVRLPATVLQRYSMKDKLIMEERSDGILLRPAGPAVTKLSWSETAQEMAKTNENWGEWESTAADGLDSVPWETNKKLRAAEDRSQYKTKSRRPGTSK